MIRGELGICRACHVSTGVVLHYTVLGEERPKPCRSARKCALGSYGMYHAESSLFPSFSFLFPKRRKNPGDPRQWVDLV